MVTKTRIISSAAILVFLALLILACGKTGDNKTGNDTQQSDKQTTDKQIDRKKDAIDTAKLVKDGKYLCSMHPLMQSNEPIKCPVCRMNMVLKSDINKEMSDEHEKMESNYAGKKNAIHFEVNLSDVKSSECKPIIESALKSDSGVLGYHVDIYNKVAHMYFDKTKTTKANIEKIISDAGYDANTLKANPEAVTKLPKDCR